VGVADALARLGIDVTVLSGPQASEHLQNAKAVEVDRESWCGWHAALLEALDGQLAASTENTVVIVRYGVSNAVRFVSRMRRLHPRVKWCYEVNSLAYHQLHALPDWLRRVILKVESRIVGQAHSSYLISDMLRKDIEPGVPRKHRCLVVPNGGPAAVQLPSARPDLTFRFVFFGMLKNYNHLDVMIDGFLYARAAGLSAELHIHGDGPELEKVQEMAKHDSQIIVHGRYDFQVLLASELSDSQCVLLLPFGDSGGLNRVQSPIKLFEYMSTGLPIIASDMPQIRLTLTHNESAMLVDPRSAKAWGEAILSLKSSEHQRQAISSELRKCYPVYTWDQRVAQLADGLRKLFHDKVDT